jgi:hypothetical protein
VIQFEHDELLSGAIDLHVHGYPDMGMEKPARLSDFSTCEMARDAGMRAIVFKSHFWPTMDRAFQLNERLGSDTFTVFSSLVLNPVIGELQPQSVEAAAAHGAKLVYLPTWGSCHDHEERGAVRRMVLEPQFPGIVRHLDEEGGFSMLLDDGSVRPEIHEIIALCRENGMTLCTGHVSPKESLEVLRAAKAAGLKKLVATHPLNPTIGTTIDECKQYIEFGALIEFTFISTINTQKQLPIQSVAKAVRELGPANCVLTTDVFFEYTPPEPESMRMFSHQMRLVGFSAEDIRTMIVHNPARLLDIA